MIGRVPETKPLRVLHLVRAMRVGGLEKVVIDLTRGLARRGIENHLGCLLEEGEWAGRCDVTGTWIGRLDERGTAAVLLDLCRYIRREGITLLHTHNSHPHKLGVPVAVLTGTPLVHTKHGRNWPASPRWVWFSRQLSRFTKTVVPVSAEIADIVTDIEKVPREKVVTILNGVDTGAYCPFEVSGVRCQVSGGEKGSDNDSGDDSGRRSVSPREPLSSPSSSTGQQGQCSGIAELRRERRIPEEAFVIGSVGRLSPEKQYPFLVKAFARFLRRSASTPTPRHSHTPTLPHPDTSTLPLLVLVGDGPEREAIEAAVQAEGVGDSVMLAGVRGDVKEWLQCMDVFCLSSDQEGTSITLLEAGACGVASVVTAVGGNPEIVAHGETGLVVPGGSEEDMVKAFADLRSDPSRTRRMGTAARKRIQERYSLDTMVEKYVDVYRNAVSPGVR